MTRRTGKGSQVLSPVIATLVRKEMIGVVENGTGARAHGGFKLPGGVVLPVGGKTGTGDNRLQEFGPRGSVIGSKVVNRTAAFVFFIGDRFFGTILAFVPARPRGATNSPARSPFRCLRIWSRGCFLCFIPTCFSQTTWLRSAPVKKIQPGVN